MKCFVDSNVFISLIQDEFGKGMEFMSYRTKEYFDRVMKCLHKIIISDSVVKEINKITPFGKEMFIEMLENFKDKIKIYKLVNWI